MNFTLDAINPMANSSTVASWNFFPHNLKNVDNTDYILFLFITVNIHDLTVPISKLYKVLQLCYEMVSKYKWDSTFSLSQSHKQMGK